MISTAKYMNKIWMKMMTKISSVLFLLLKNTPTNKDNNFKKACKFYFQENWEVDNLQFSKCVYKMSKLLRSTRSSRRRSRKRRADSGSNDM